MRHYELMTIINGDLDDATVEATNKRFTDLVTQLDGKMLNVDFWGKRKFAYEINHKTHGFYTVMDFELDPDGLSELTRQLRIADEIVRFKVVRPDIRTKKTN